jgi:anaerobic selenocysteine-containing dehydrogenase
MYRDETGMVLIHPEDAKQYDIVDGSELFLLNFRGRKVRKALVTERTQKGLLVAEGIYGRQDKREAAVSTTWCRNRFQMRGKALFFMNQE